MLRSMLDYAKLSVSTLAGRIVGGAIIVVPFMIAASFALAAIYMALRNSYGDVMAAVMLAVAFAVIGLVAAIIVVARIRQQERHLEELRADARQSALTSAFLAINPALMLGAARVGLGLFRRAPILTATLPLVAGFFLAMASADQRRRAKQTGGGSSPPRPPRSGNSREIIH